MVRVLPMPTVKRSQSRYCWQLTHESLQINYTRLKNNHMTTLETVQLNHNVLHCVGILPSIQLLRFA